MAQSLEHEAQPDPSRVQLPGFGLPIDTLPDWSRDDKPEWNRYPHAIADQLASQGVTLRERRMLEFICQITDKPEWDRKVFDEAIVGKWREEACSKIDEINDVFLSEKMFEYCIAELREKAERFKATKLIHVLDCEATVVKSDTMVPADLAAALKDVVRSLEDIPENQKDWHPGSNETVWDLVHPSMYPLVYGTSRALPHGTVPRNGCSEYTGEGEIVPGLEDKTIPHTATLNGWGNDIVLPAWGSYQWLPTDIRWRRGEDRQASIESYINNLNPVKHAKAYPVLERLLDCALPLWNDALSYFHERFRIKIENTNDEDFVIPEDQRFPGASDHSEDSDFFWEDDDYREWKERVRVLKHREPEDFQSFEKKAESSVDGYMPHDLRDKFASSGLQVIFKLANIHLSPEKPKYSGGSWHVEGALNEHICATALYYYDQENITDSYLSFRQSIDAEVMTMIPDQSEYSSLEAYYGVEQEGPCIQELGKVLTREGRMLVFPNVLQHQVHDFELKDKTKPGHRKILAMFLVDPHIRVLSTANVPPQQREWWADEVRKVRPLAELPREIFDKIIASVDGFPISYEDACEYRDELMGQRGVLNEFMDEGWTQETFFFCEH